MAVISAGSTYKHRTFCFCGDQLGLNTRYFLVVSLTGTAPTEATFVATLDAIIAPLYKPAMHNSAQYIGTDIQNISGVIPFPVQIGTQSNIGNGTGGAGTLPSQVSGIYTVRTALTGRSYRGRQYIPFPPAAAVLGGTLPEPTGAYQTLMLNIGNALVANQTYSSGGATIVVTWGLRHQRPAGIAGTFTPSTVIVAPQAFATQKRRGDYGRTNPQPEP